MPTDSSSDELDAIIDKATVALTGYTEEQTVNPDLPSLLEITDFDTRVVNTYELKQAIDRLIADKVAEANRTLLFTITSDLYELADSEHRPTIGEVWVLHRKYLDMLPAQLRQNREGADNE